MYFFLLKNQMARIVITRASRPFVDPELDPRDHTRRCTKTASGTLKYSGCGEGDRTV